MVELVFSPRLQAFFKKAADDSRLNAALRKELRHAVDESAKTVPHTLLAKAWRAAFDEGVTTERLHELVQGSMIYEEPYVPPPKSAELLARLERLEAEQAERDYRRIVSNVDSEMAHERRVTDLIELKNVKQQAFMFLNVVLSFVGVWAFVYYALHTTFSSQGMRALFATLAGIVALTAEMWLYLKADVMKPERRKNKKKSRVGPLPPSCEKEVPLIAANTSGDKKED